MYGYGGRFGVDLGVDLALISALIYFGLIQALIWDLLFLWESETKSAGKENLENIGKADNIITIITLVKALSSCYLSYC